MTSPGRGRPGGFRDRRRAVAARCVEMPGRLSALLALLIVLSGVFAVGLYTVQSHARRVTTAVGSGPVTASLAAGKARVALADADRVVATSYLSGGAEQLSGAGPVYQDDVKVASQALAAAAAAAAATQAGPGGAEAIQAAEAQLVPYMGLVDNAHADADRYVLGVAQLAYAAELMHASEWTSSASVSDGLLALVRQLTDNDEAQVAAARSTPSAGALALPVAAGAALVVALVLGQVYLFRVSRRVINIGLAGATVVALVLLAFLGQWATQTRGDLRDGAAALRRASAVSRTREVVADAYGARARALLVSAAAAGALGAAPGDTAEQLRLAGDDVQANTDRFAALLAAAGAAGAAGSGGTTGGAGAGAGGAGGATAAERADLERARAAFARFTTLDGEVARLAATGREPEARAMTLQAGSGRLPAEFRQANDSLAAAGVAAESAAVAAMAAAADDDLGSGLPLSAGWTITLAAVLLVLLVAGGMAPRISEYR